LRDVNVVGGVRRIAMDVEYVFRGLPAEVWAIEFTNVRGDRVVQVVGTEYAARQAAEHYAVANAVLLRAPTSFQTVPSDSV
jgi:hypothetical protein